MTALLEAKGICKYFGGLKAVNQVDLTVNQGDIFGIIGPNGAGKTTFFNVCTGVLKPSCGRIWFDGEEITGLYSEQIARKGMARTFQTIHLFKYMSVLDNVKIGFHINTETRIADALLHTKRYKKDEQYAQKEGIAILEKIGLSKYKDTKAGTLAYGTQRRVEIARALALNPKILLLDEPAAGMNPFETQELMELIRQLNAEGYTIVVIEHDMKFVMNLCNRIIVLNFGEKLCEGKPAEILENKAVHEAYFGKRFAAGEVVKSDA